MNLAMLANGILDTREKAEAYAKRVAVVTKKKHVVFPVPEGSVAYKLGYRFGTCAVDEAKDYGVKLYRIVWVRDDNDTRGVLFPGPLTHEEAETCLKKVTRYSWRREMLEEL